MYKMIIIIGEAGSGKDTIMKEVMKRSEAGSNPASILTSTVSCTTRPPRDYEIDGVDYHFIDKETFANTLLDNQFLEFSEFNNWFYGTLKTDLSQSKINIAVLNPGGVESVLLHKDINVKVFYLDVPGRIRLIRQLQREENPDIPEIYRRYMADDEDFFNLPFEHETLANSTEEDYNNAVNRILDFARNWAKEDK